MTTQELIEFAALDALGLLEPHERDAFEAAFSAATPHVQAHVRREQKRFAVSTEALLPDVEPPAGLRFKVLSAVRDAMKLGSPLHVNRERAQANQPMLLRFWSSALMWRVAAIALATATVTLGVVTVNLVSAQQHESNSIAGQAGLETHRELVAKHGRTIADILIARRVVSTNLAADADREGGSLAAHANVYFDPDAGRGALLCRGLPVVNAAYKVVILDDQGNVLRTLREFDATGPEQSIILPHGLSQTDAQNIAVLGPAERDGRDELIVAAMFA
jgi:hypothetical protein